MLLPMCCCVCRRCCHLCIPCSVVPVVLALSVVVSSMADLPRLPLPQLSPTMGPSSKPSDNDVNNNPAGEPCHLAGRASQTSTAPSRLCRACGPYLSPSLSSSVLSSRNAPLKVGVTRPQEIAHVLSRFPIGVLVVIIVLCRDTVAIVAIPIILPNEWALTSL